MAYTILTESYKRRLPLITATADSADDLATLGTDYAEGSTCVIGETTYKLDKVQGWTDGSGGGGGGGGGGSFIVNITSQQGTSCTVDKTAHEIVAAAQSGLSPVLVYSEGDDEETEIRYIPITSVFYGEEDGVPFEGAVFMHIYFPPAASTVTYTTYTISSEDGGQTTGSIRTASH